MICLSYMSDVVAALHFSRVSSCFRFFSYTTCTCKILMGVHGKKYAEYIFTTDTQAAKVYNPQQEK